MYHKIDLFNAVTYKFIEATVSIYSVTPRNNELGFEPINFYLVKAIIFSTK